MRDSTGRLHAALFDLIGARFERRHGAVLRRRHLAAAAGRVLEIGAGTGANLAHYPSAVTDLVLSEPDPAKLRRARRRAGGSPRRVELVQAAAESLPFPDRSFDTVVSTTVLCSVTDVPAALREVGRVLKPAGHLLFAEHVRSADPSRARWQDRLERPWGVIGGGCHPNRDTGAFLAAAGFVVEIEEEGELPMVPRLVRPFIAGRAMLPSDDAG